MIRSLDIAREIIRYLSGDVDLTSFREWSVAVRHDHNEELDSDASRLVAAICSWYAEFSQDVINEQDLKDGLRSLALGAFQNDAENSVAAPMIYVQVDQLHNLIGSFSSAQTGEIGNFCPVVLSSSTQNSIGEVRLSAVWYLSVNGVHPVAP